MTPRDDTPLLGPDEAAKLLNSNPRTIERWRMDGGGPIYIKVGRRVAYRRADLLQFIKEHTYQSTAEADAARTKKKRAKAKT
jgi:Helix-turn-helix domain